jgi:translation elongation factor EF-G
MHMARTLNEWQEPDEANMPSGEWKILITVPEEFVGVAVQELQVREGLINGMEGEQHNFVVRASLPASQYAALVAAIATGTQRRGRVALAES